MSNSETSQSTLATRASASGTALMPAAIGIIMAMLLIVVVGSTTFANVRLATLLGYLCVWLPLLAAIVVVGNRQSREFLRRVVHLSLRPMDLIWGLGVGLLARTVASLIEILGYGSIGSAGVRLGDPVYDVWWLFGALLAPVLLAPVIEEVFFRGLVLRAVCDTVEERWAVPIAIAVSGLTFALMHLIALDPNDLAAIAVVGSSTLIFGLAAAALSVLTGRIGGAIIAHVTFNALVIVPALL